MTSWRRGTRSWTSTASTSPDLTLARPVAGPSGTGHRREVLRGRTGPTPPADAELVLSTRDQLDDAAFEATMRSTLGLTW